MYKVYYKSNNNNVQILNINKNIYLSQIINYNIQKSMLTQSNNGIYIYK